MWKLIGVLLAVGLVVQYWWLILPVVAVLLAVKYAPPALRALDAQADANLARARDITHRADVQHQQVLDGDPRGLYGIYTPAC